MRKALPAALLLALLPAGHAAPAAADVLARTLQVSVDFAQGYGSGARSKTPADARLRLFTEIAGECPRLEKMSGLACRIESLSLRTEERAGRAALQASVRFALESRAGGAASGRRGEEFRFERKPGLF